MKKLALFLVIALASTAAFAKSEFDVLGNAFYVGSDNSDFSTDQISMKNFWPGAEMRLKLGILRFDAGMIAILGSDVTGIYMPLDAGLSLDLLFIRAGAGIGTQFAMADEGFIQAGYNLKVSADLLLGGLDLGLVAYNIGSSFDRIFSSEDLGDINNWLIGATLGFRFR